MEEMRKKLIDGNMTYNEIMLNIEYMDNRQDAYINDLKNAKLL